MKSPEYVELTSPQIRNKRLAKLSNPNPSPSQDNISDSAQSSAHTSPSQSPLSAHPPSGFYSGSPSSLHTPQQSEGKRIKITPVAQTPERTRSNPPSAPGTPPPQKIESIETFEDRTLSAVFKVTLKDDGRQDIHGKRTFLPGLRSELEGEGQDLRIQVSVLDQALLEAASNAEKNRPLDYLLPCWKRITRLSNGFRRAGNDDPKYQILCEARRLCMSYCIFAITMPEMFGYVSLEYEASTGCTDWFIEAMALGNHWPHTYSWTPKRTVVLTSIL
jgi:ubiquitin conjugation factor E4 B